MIKYDIENQFYFFLITAVCKKLHTLNSFE